MILIRTFTIVIVLFYTKDGNDEENNIRRVVEDDAQIL